MPRHPLTAVPATRSSLPVLALRRRVVLGLMTAASVSGLVSTVAWLAASDNTPQTVTLPDPVAVSLAQTVALDFLSARQSSVPAAKDVNNNFADPHATPGSAARGTPSAAANGQPAPKGLTVDALTFTGSAPWVLGDGTHPSATTEQESFNALVAGQLYTVVVPMVKSGSSWLLAASPALEPTALDANQSGDGIDYGSLYANGGTDSLLPNEDYRSQIKLWAQTFASEGHASSKLYALTGDQSSRTYSGLGGWTLTEDPEIKSVVPVSTPHPGLIVRVRLVLRSPAPNGPTLSTDYDLYIRTDAGQQQPPIVAWGAAGSYKSLQPYFNADQP